MKNFKTLTLTALVAAAFSVPAFAQVPVASNGTDLILGFQIDDNVGQGANTNLEVDLGSFSQFTLTSVVNSTGPTGLQLADLVSTYGANFSTRGDLIFNVAGTTTANNLTGAAYVTQFGTPQVSTSAFNASSKNIFAVEQFLGTTGTPTGDSTEAGTIGTATSPASGMPGSLSSENFASGQYGFFNITSGIPTTSAVIDGPLTTLNLYSYVVGSGRSGTPPSLLGTFSLTSAGSFTYAGANSVVPEPSTYALMALGLGMMVFVVRRRSLNA